MHPDPVDPTGEAPEADLAEQAQEVDEPASEPVSGDVAGPADRDRVVEADDADLLEQATPVPGTEDDYPRDGE